MPDSRRRLSVTARLVMGYTLGCATCLLAVGWLSDYTLGQRFDKRNADLLADHLAEIRKTVLENPDDLHEAAEVILISSTSHRANIFYGQLTDERGKVLATTYGFDQVVPDSGVFPAAIGPDESSDHQPPVRLTHPSGVLFLLAAKVRQFGDRPALIYRVALNAGHVEEWLTDYNRTFGIFTAIATVASALFGWLVARNGLAPLRDITRSVQQVTAKGLAERLGAKPWPAELTALAGEFDRMLERLEQSFQRLSQFTADAAHEFRTPLNNLIGATSLLLSRERPVADLREALVNHLEQYERLNRMIESLLFLARADGNTNADLHPLDAGRLVRETVEFFGPLAEDGRVSMAVVGEAVIAADESMLRMVFINLIANALRFTPPGGTVTIRINPSDQGRTVVTVADTGCGIPPQHLPRIFDRFYRVDAARNCGGAGLGLALVQSIMSLHQGRVTVTSQQGIGTTFELVFPDSKGLRPEARG